MNITRYAMIVVVAMASIGAFAAMQASPSEEAYATGDYPKPPKCDSSDEPPFKDFPGASGATGNPHTCEQPTGDPHDDPDNPQEGNPHNTE
jgi:hypothetical protein